MPIQTAKTNYNCQYQLPIPTAKTTHCQYPGLPVASICSTMITSAEALYTDAKKVLRLFESLTNVATTSVRWKYMSEPVCQNEGSGAVEAVGAVCWSGRLLCWLLGLGERLNHDGGHTL